jgi:hypothetical protein
MAIATPAWTYEPLTDDEVRAYWSTLSEAEKLDEIRTLDIIEHAPATIDVPPIIIVAERDGTVTAYYDAPLTIDIAGRLQYETTLPQGSIETKPHRPWLWFGVGAAIGASVVLILN